MSLYTHTFVIKIMKTDLQLVHDFQSGNFDDFWLLYERYLDKIFVYIFRKIGDRSEAEDICSQVWMKVLRDLQKWKKDDDFQFQSWIYRIAHNAVVDYYRTRKETVSEEILEFVALSDDITKSIAQGDILEQVEKYMSEMKESEKNILFLRLWDEMSYSEIAEFIWKSEAACKQIVKRWLEKLRANIHYIFLIFMIL